MTFIKLIIYAVLALLLATVVYFSNPSFKIKVDNFVLAYLHDKKVKQYQEDQLRGKIKILVNLEEL